MSWPYSKVTSVSLSEQLSRLTQRTGGATGSLRTDADRVAFQISSKEDLANAFRQLNNVYYNLARTLSDVEGMDALQFGLSGNVIYTDIEATEASADAYWYDGQARGRTVKETIDVLLSELARLENAINNLSAGDATTYDDSELRSLIETNSQNIDQVVLDAFGSSYTLNGTGTAGLIYSLAHHIDSIGALITGYTGTGLTHPGSPAYPTLSLPSAGAFETVANVTSNSPGDYATDDFVFGSDSLDDDGNAAHDARMFYDKSKFAFRAGKVTGTQWDSTEIGDASIAWGENNKAANPWDVCGGYGNVIEGTPGYGLKSGFNAIVTGVTNTIATDLYGAFIGTGENSAIGTDGYYSSILNGDAHILEGWNSSILGGSANELYGQYCVIGGGATNVIGTTTNSANFTYSVIAGGESNQVQDHYGSVGGGTSNVIAAGGDYGTIPGGRENLVNANYGTAIGYGAVAGHYGASARAAGYRVAAGDVQVFDVSFRGVTANNTPTDLWLGGSPTNRLTIQDGEVMTITVTVAAIEITGTTDTAAYHGVYQAKNIGGTVTVTPVVALSAVEDDAAWAFALVADSPNSSVNAQVTGDTNNQVSWNVDCHCVLAS